MVDDMIFASQALIGFSGVYRQKQIMVRKSGCAPLRGAENRYKSTLFPSKQMV